MRSTLMRVGLLGVLVTLLIGLPFANGQLAELAGLGENLLPLWLGARVGFLRGESPYRGEAMIAAYEENFGAVPPGVTEAESLEIRLPPPGLLLGMATMLAPYQVARALWLSAVQVSLALLLLVALALVRWRPPPSVLGLLLAGTLLWRYGLQSMLVGASDPLVILLLLTGLWAVSGQNDVGAAILLGLATIRPDLSGMAVLFAWIWGLAQRRWTLAVGLPVVFLSLWGTMIAWHPPWFAGWLSSALAAIRNDGLNSPLSRLGSNLLSVALGLPVIALLLWAWIVSLRRGSSSFLWTSVLTLGVTSVLLAPAPLSPALLTMPALLLSFRVWLERWGRAGAVGVGVVGGLLLGAPWLAYWSADPTAAVGPAVIWLPVLLSLVSLLWIRWWVVDQARLPLAAGGREGG